MDNVSTDGTDFSDVTPRTERGLSEPAKHEPIAIIGIGCRFPGGVDSPDAFWELLHAGIDAIGPVPADRFNVDAFYDSAPATPGKIATREGGWLDRIDEFDAAFFGISPREVISLDPQQRLLLEVTWEALEDAGLPRQHLAGSRTGVFVGMWTNDYAERAFAASDDIDLYVTTGGGRYSASGRLSFAFDLRGPSLTVDTACSSSLVAVHLACQSLRSGESELAIAGGSNLILQPQISIAYSRSGMLSPDARCRFGDAEANGYVRSEGVGVLVLKPLGAALAAGDPIYALIRGSTVNNDGRSNGLLVAPSKHGQAAMLRAAYRDARLDPALVGYVEAHGTGTRAGDPVEVEALGQVLGSGRPADRPCLIGSVKTNIGHTEAASGVAGLIKAVLCLQHREVPASLHLRTPNPSIAWQDLGFVVPRTPTPWPVTAEPAYAGVSSFGVTGTNAHVVLQAAPERQSPQRETAETDSGPQVLALSAHSPEALVDLADRCHTAFEQAALSVPPGLRDLCFTAAVRRSHHEHRLAVVGRTREELAGHLAAFARGEARPSVVTGLPVSESDRRVVFVFSGQGSQWPGMARQLVAEEPVFRAALEHCDQAMRAFVSWSLVERVCADPVEDCIEEIDVVQPTLFGIQVALAALWQSWGIEPAAVVGHSMGEVAAAHVAGALSLDDAARIICRRSQLLRRVRGQGAMAVVGLSAERARAALTGYEDCLSIAVSNSARSTVVSGDPAALERVLDELRRCNVFCRPIKVDVASHSPQMDALCPDLATALRDIRPRPAAVPIYSTVNGDTIVGQDAVQALSAAYWVRNLRQPVRFADAVNRLIRDGLTAFVELSPHPILLASIGEVLADCDTPGCTVPSMRRDVGEREAMLTSLGTLYTTGCSIDWSRLYPEGDVVRLPRYPFQRTRFWLTSEPGVRQAPDTSGGHAGDDATRGRYLGRRMPSLAHLPGSHFWQLTGDDWQAHPYLAQRKPPYGDAVVSDAFYVEMALAAAQAMYDSATVSVSELTVHEALIQDEEATSGVALTLQVIVTPGRGNGACFQIFSQTAAGSWTLHADGRLRVGSADELPVPPSISLAAVQARATEQLSGDAWIRRLNEHGFEPGPSRPTFGQVWRGPAELLWRFEPTAEAANGRHDANAIVADAGDGKVGAPANPRRSEILKTAFEVLAAGLPVRQRLDDGTPVLLAGVERARLFGCLDTVTWGYVRTTSAAGMAEIAASGDLYLLDDHGQVVAECAGVRYRPVNGVSDGRLLQARLARRMYEIIWPVLARSRQIVRPRTGAGTWLIFADNDGVGASLAALVTARGHDAILIQPGDTYAASAPDQFVVNPGRTDDVRRLVADALTPERPPCRGVIYLWGTGVADDAEVGSPAWQRSQLLTSAGALHVSQALVDGVWAEAPRLWLVTRGSQPVGGANPASAVPQAALWGLGRVFALEHPEFWGGLADLDPERVEDDLPALLDEIMAPDGEDQIGFRGGQRHVARLVRASAACGYEQQRNAATATTIRSDRTYLITGGLGGLGLEVARWLVRCGARHLALLGRRGAVGPAVDAVRELEAADVAITVLHVDVSDAVALGRALATLSQTMPPLCGVFHAAGVLEDGALQRQSWASFERVLAPKAYGAWNLHLLTRALPIEEFVLFSSVTAVLGTPGQSNYAAANAFLDALAHRRRAEGLPATSVNWGPWSGVGLATAADRGKLLARRGIGMLTPSEGIAALDTVLRTGPTQIGVFTAQWPTQIEHLPRGAATPFLAELVQALELAQPETPPQPQRHEILGRLAAAAPADRHDLMREYVCTEVAAVLRLDAGSRLDPARGFFQMGMDSLMAVELKTRLQTTIGRPLVSTLAFDYPTADTIAAYLLAELYSSDAATATGPEDVVAAEDGAGDAFHAELDGLSHDDLKKLLEAELQTTTQEMAR
ncbi:MAG: type I polyketide synthase [Chloroflexota bacterium]